MNKDLLVAVIRISRPVNVLISIISIFVAAFITGTIEPFAKVLIACLSGGIIMAAANTINDYFDLDIDRINRPDRPLVMNILTPLQAVQISTFEFTLGIMLAFFISLLAFLIAGTVSAIIFLYSYKWKRMPLIGNLAVSFSTAMAFVYGGVAVNRIKQTLVPAVFAFFYHFGREIIKDVQDMEGDRQGRARTLPLVYGEVTALAMATVNFLILMILLPLPYLILWYRIGYLAVVIVGVYPVLIYTLISMWKNRTPGNLGMLSTLLKADMLVGLLAIYLG
jgi:geranylgeranylglycerol-phosphate geranylgeranyltransferase